MGGSFLRVRGSLTALDSEPRFAGKLKAVLQGILRFCGGRIWDEIGGRGQPEDVPQRSSPAEADTAPRQCQGPGGAGRGRSVRVPGKGYRVREFTKRVSVRSRDVLRARVGSGLSHLRG